MQDVPQIKAAYDWMINAYRDEVLDARAAGDKGTVVRLGARRDSLERGVFVMLFGQFEKLVNEYFEQARDSRVANPDWSHRRGWDVPALTGRRIPFETKLALVLDRNGLHYGNVVTHYQVRNHCAHGGSDQPVGSIDQFVKDLYTWQGQLRK
jgi:hypothetical protein